MTYSIGFRAPSRAELIENWCRHQADAMTDEDRYADPDLIRQSNAGEIAASAIDRMHVMAMEALSDRNAFARWFGLHNRSEEHTSELQSLMRISYAVFCLKKKT